MRSFVMKLLREPYVHFLLTGLALYFWYTLASDQPKNLQPTREVALTLSQQQNLRESFKQAWGRPPRPEEFTLLANETLLEEMLVDEAIALELPRRDAQIRQRLLEKMRFILARSASVQEPNEAELRQYYKKHRDTYRDPEKVHFFHIYAPRGKEAALERLGRLLEANATSPQKAHLFGEAVTYGNEIGPVDIQAVETLLGSYFTGRLVQLRSGVWQGPIRSKEGYHLIYLLAKEGGKILPFEEVEDRVYRDMLQEQRERMAAQSLEKIRRSFRTKIE
jgi:hypothetical protein